VVTSDKETLTIVFENIGLKKLAKKVAELKRI
jgi:hypothetical protein